MSDSKLYVTCPLLPDLDQLEPYLKSIWDCKWVTNHGRYHYELEKRLREELKVPTVAVFNNGTIGLITALKMFGFKTGDEVITTPFTFAATAHAIAWNNLKPVFADIDNETLTLDPAAVERAVTRRTCAVLGVHVYGNACDVEAMQSIADRHNLKLIYDAAHAFGTEIKGRGIGAYGDASVFSFHATKLYTTLEGGCVTTPWKEDAENLYWLRNFGIEDEENVVDIGINGKLNEIQAAIGLLNLDIYKKEKKLRANIRKQYVDGFQDVDGISILNQQSGVTPSEQYYVIRIDAELFGKTRNQVHDFLRTKNIFARKYFHPICTDFLPYRDYEVVSCNERTVVSRVKDEVLCLPFHSGLEPNDIDRVIHTVLELKEQ